MKTFKIRKMMSSSALRWYALVTALVAIAAYALTPVDTVITNRAVVEYEDGAGNEFSSESNPAEVIVGAVYRATIEQDRLDYTGAAGQQVYLPYVLSNNGNSTDVFDLSVVEEIANGANAVDGNIIDLDNTNDGVIYQIFRDDDGDGEPDSGATDLSGSTISVPAETNQSLVVAITIPATASAGDFIGAVLTASDSDGNIAAVDDITDSDGEDGLEETVQALVEVTTDAVLVLTKDSVINTGAQTISYTLTVKNNGSVAATDVDIYDFVPYADINSNGIYDSGTDFYLPYTSGVSDSGLLTANGDEDAAVYDGGTNFGNIANAPDRTLDEDDYRGDGGTTTDDILDIDDNNDTTGDVVGAVGEELIHARDASLGSNVEVSVTFTVSYAGLASSVPQGTLVRNQFCTVADLDGAGSDPAEAQCSNETIDPFPAIYDVEVGDSTPGTLVGDNQGSASYSADDADTTNNDDQLVASASEGATVVFYHVIENTGNAEDSFTVNVAGDEDFPAGTTFAYNDATGNPLSSATTPILQGGDTYVVQVVATLPDLFDSPLGGNSTVLTGDGSNIYLDVNGLSCVNAGATTDCTTDGLEFTTTLTATSTNGGQTDTTALSLTLAGQSTPDLANGTAASEGASLTDLGNYQPDGGAIDGSEPYVSIFSNNLPGETVTIPLTISNETGVSDTFAFDVAYVGRDPDATTNDGSTPASYDTPTDTSDIESADGVLPDGWSIVYQTTAGAPIGSTTLLPDGNTFDYQAVITISSDGAEALPGEYDLRFSVTGIVSGQIDTKLDTIEVVENCQIALTEDQDDVIQKGGTVDFDHILRNTGNVSREITPTVSAAPSGWSYIIFIEENATGDFVAYADGVDVAIYNTVDGSSATTDTVASGVFDLDAGEYVNVRVRVFAPATAITGQSNSLTLTATPNAGSSCNAVSNTDTVEVIDEQVRIFKTVSVDTDCDCDVTDASFSENGGEVEPGECAVWRLRAENQGDTNASNVVIRDSVTEYTSLVDLGTASTYVDSELRECIFESDDSDGNGDGCTFGTADFDSASPSATVDGSNISWAVGTLVSGDAAEATFCVQIQ